MPTANLTRSVTMPSGVGFSFSALSAIVGTADQLVNAALPAASTNAPVVAQWLATGPKLVVMLSDQDCTIKTNSSGSPANTFALKAGVPFIWDSGSGYYATPFAADVAGLFVTCTLATSLQVYVLS